MPSLYDRLMKAESAGEEIAICTIVNTRGSTPRKKGAKMIVDKKGNIEGTIGGGEFERSVIKEAIDVLGKGEPVLYRHDLLHQHSMCCGGSIDIFIEPVKTKNNLYIFGAGHVGQALAQFAKEFDFQVVVIDDRKEFIDQVTTEVNKMHLPFNKALSVLPFQANTYVCIMTYDHGKDRDILAECLKKPHAYLGMIGSRRKVEVTRKMFREAEIAGEKELNAIDMPMGINLGGEGPGEIALSIISKLVQVKNQLKVDVK